MEIQEEICQAHMAGQMDAGCTHPSWSNASAYFKSVEEKFNSLDHIKTEITVILNRYDLMISNPHCEIPDGL